MVRTTPGVRTTSPRCSCEPAERRERSQMIRQVVERKRIVVCVGPGGVGKTTTAAALGALGARLGRKTLVCTIDPAPRLADALGTGGLGPEPRLVPVEACRALGIDEAGAGNLYAVRLDTA